MENPSIIRQGVASIQNEGCLDAWAETPPPILGTFYEAYQPEQKVVVSSDTIAFRGELYSLIQVLDSTADHFFLYDFPEPGFLRLNAWGETFKSAEEARAFELTETKPNRLYVTRELRERWLTLSTLSSSNRDGLVVVMSRLVKLPIITPIMLFRTAEECGYNPLSLIPAVEEYYSTEGSGDAEVERLMKEVELLLAPPGQP